MLADFELASRCVSGDEDAWKELVQRFHKKVWHVAFQFTGRADEAEELSQDIFLHLLNTLERFDREGSLAAWVHRVARNFAIDHYRHRRRERALVPSGEDPEERLRAARDTSRRGDPHKTLEEKDLAGWLRAAIDRLPAELGQAVMMRDLWEMTYDEMATSLGIPLGTVKSRINRGRVELARILKRRRREWTSVPGDTGEVS